MQASCFFRLSLRLWFMGNTLSICRCEISKWKVYPKQKLSFVQPLSLTSFDSSPSRGALGIAYSFAVLPRPLLLGEVAMRQH